MFNSTSNNTAVSFNSVQGMMVKSHPKSKFKRFHTDSELSSRIFNLNKPTVLSGDYAKEIVILQCMLSGEDHVIVEWVYLDDFEKGVDSND